MQNLKILWILLAAVVTVSFAGLGLIGQQIYVNKPPIPTEVVAESGEVLFTRDEIEMGRQVWQSMGGHQLGSIWGHGAYLTPDWSAEWLHRELVMILDQWALRDYASRYDDLSSERQAALRDRLQKEMRNNRVDDNERLLVSDVRAAAIRANQRYYEELFGAASNLSHLREQYAMPENPIPDPARRQALTAFFFWASWATTTNRPGDDVTYTMNWPHEPLVGNVVTTEAVVWSVASFIALIGAIGLLVWYQAIYMADEPLPAPPITDPLEALRPTYSMLATRKYFYVVILLFLTQIGLGTLTAHYTVEGQHFYGFPLADYLPYAVTRTWHTQIAVFWIATAWLATGLYIAPAIGGDDPKGQTLGVNLLFLALLIVVGGSLAGEWFGVQQRLGLDWNFWFGHQGYEYIDLGRFWQILLFVGLLLWLFLVGRAIWPALAKPSDSRPLISMVFISTIAIALFYAAGFAWGKHTHLSMIEYWRWWVVHLWVEGFFEVFATAVIALLFLKLGLVRPKVASIAVIFSTIIFLSGGIIGTLHHLYWAGGPASVMALGAVFSALEVVPLVLLGLEGYHNYRYTRTAPWVAAYRWPILFFVAVAFWNMLGAGVFGFLVNPPISLYYIQGLNTTAVHAHGALFGVYGMLGIGLMLFCLRGMSSMQAWDDRLLKWGFWCLNIGLAMMLFLSLLPIGVIQGWAAVAEGFWYARSVEVVQSPLVRTLVWMRVPGDIVFGTGALLIGIFAARLWHGSRGHVRARKAGETPSPLAAE
ncbi:MAG: nitric-oxide reductase large subunit [Rhodospirillales bacterium]